MLNERLSGRSIVFKLEWVDWFKHRRLLEAIGEIPPAELEHEYYRQTSLTPWWRDSHTELSGKPGAVHPCFCELLRSSSATSSYNASAFDS